MAHHSTKQKRVDTGEFAPELHDAPTSGLVPEDEDDAGNNYMIPDEQMEPFEKKFAAIQKRARKLGVPEPTYEVVGTYTDEWDASSRFKVSGSEVVVSGAAPKYDGWSPVAVIDLGEPEDHGTGNVVHRIDKEEEAEESWYNVGDVCDHCGRNHVGRKKLIAVKHDDGSRKTVGTSCLKDFLGHTAPDSIARWAEYISDPDEMLGGFQTAENPMYDPKDFLGAVAVDIEENGWISGSMAYDSGSVSTVNRLKDRFAKGTAPSAGSYTDEQIAEVEAALEWASEQDKDPDANDYLRNIAALSRRGAWRGKDLGMAGSILASHRHSIERGEAQRRRDALYATEDARRAASQHVGAVGDKIAFQGRVQMVRTFPGYGYYSPDRAMVKMIDESGNTVIWWASDASKAPDEGTNVSVERGTVKEHAAYQGENQTVVTRCKWEPGTSADDKPEDT